MLSTLEGEIVTTCRTLNFNTLGTLTINTFRTLTIDTFSTLTINTFKTLTISTFRTLIMRTLLVPSGTYLTAITTHVVPTAAAGRVIVAGSRLGRAGGLGRRLRGVGIVRVGRVVLAVTAPATGTPLVIVRPRYTWDLGRGES